MIVACAQNFFAVVVGDRRKIYSVKTDVHLSESQDNQKLNFVAGCRFAVDERPPWTGQHLWEQTQAGQKRRGDA